jgi:predicted GNAT superfamily acetyltransferase
MIGYQMIVIGNQQWAGMNATIKKFRDKCWQRAKIRFGTFMVIDRVVVATVYRGKSVEKVFQ